MTVEKILKIKVGEVFIEGKSYPVFKTAWKRKSKEGNEYWVAEDMIFVNEIERCEKEEVKKPKPTL